MEEQAFRIPMSAATGLLGEFTGRVNEALLAAVRLAAVGAELTMIEVQIHVLAPSLIYDEGCTMTARCIRRGTNILFAKGEVADSSGRPVALATATFAHAR